ncbi:hypothetical protein G9U51_07360 [Calidifontibacter sp. DB0510]|uniref:Uncharacterized protein n=1 Tax=Metallococcus carri TaxID=1656884 RepID=A0A967B034_9MICO|nr:hypothetical protein [Metallococcus carri]NHN55597.1 hypothetical protein [Metallococcus carri]NOP38219.1 hypothetical protein [Calidifontibacter sp. DB2511S]
MSTVLNGRQATVPASKIRLARALVRDADRRGVTEDDWIVRLAQRPLPGESRSKVMR